MKTFLIFLSFLLFAFASKTKKESERDRIRNGRYPRPPPITKKQLEEGEEKCKEKCYNDLLGCKYDKDTRGVECNRKNEFQEKNHLGPVKIGCRYYRDGNNMTTRCYGSANWAWKVYINDTVDLLRKDDFYDGIKQK